MLSLAFFPVIIELYGALIKWQGSLSTVLETVLSSPKSLVLLEQLKVWREWILSAVQDISASPILRETRDKCLKWYSSSSAHLKDASTEFLDKNPAVKARADLFIKNMITISQDAMIYLYGKGEKLLQHPALQSIVRRPTFQNLANHPLMQRLYEHPNIQETYAVKTANHVTEDTMQSFLKTISFSTYQGHDDPSKVTMKLVSPKAEVNGLVQNMESMKKDSLAADNFVWVCTCVLAVVAVTSLSWLAILLSSKGVKYQRSVKRIGYLVTGILAAFFLSLSFKLRSVDEDAHTILKYLLAFSYLPFLFLIAVVSFRTWGHKAKEQTKETQHHEKTVGELKKQMQEMQLANLKSISEKETAHESNRLLLEESSSDLKSKLLAMSADLAAARTSEENALKKAETAQQQILATPTKTVILQMDMDASDGGMTMPRSAAKAGQHQSRTRDILNQLTPNTQKNIDAQIAEQDLEASEQLTTLQDELSQERSTRVKAEASIDELQKQLKDTEAAQQSTAASLEQVKVLTAGQKTRLQALRAELTTLQAEKVTLTKELDGGKKTLALMVAEKSGTLTAAADLTSKLTAAKTELATLTELKLNNAKQGDTFKKEQELLTTTLRNQLSDLEKAEASALSQVTTLQNQAKTIGEENEKVKSELQTKLHGLQEELTTAVSSKEAIMLELEDGKKHMAVIIAEKHSVHSNATDIKAALESSKNESLTLNSKITVLKKKVEDITKELSTVVAAKEVDCKNLEQSNRSLQAAQAHLTAVQTEKEALTYELGVEKKNLAVMTAEKDSTHSNASDMRAQLEIIAAARQADSAREIKGLNVKLTVVQEELATERELLYVKIDSLTDRLNATETAKRAALLAVEEAEAKLVITHESLKVSDAARQELTTQLESTNATLAVSEGLKKSLGEETVILKGKCDQLQGDLEKVTSEAGNHKIALHTEATELQSKLAGSRESLRLATLDCTTTRELTKSTAKEYQRQLSEKAIEITTLEAALREAEAAHTLVIREGEETKARLTAQIAKNAVDIANNEEELRDMEISLKSFLDVCNSTRVSLVSAQDDLKVSELRRVEDSAAFQIKLKESEQAKITLVDQCETGRVKLVALEVEAMSAASTGETGLDRLKELLEASEEEKRRVTSLADELKLSLSTAKEVLIQVNDKNEMEINALHTQIDALQIEKQTSTTLHDAIAVRLNNALEEIKFFEKERSEDIVSVQRELKESARARKEVTAEFEIAKKDLSASGNVLLNSRTASPMRRPSGTITPRTPPIVRPTDKERSRSPILSSAIEKAVLQQMIDDLTVSCEAATTSCKKLQVDLDVALQDLEICETQRTMQVEQMQQALEALEALEEERETLIGECNRLRTKLGMSPHTENVLNGSDEAMRIQDDERLAVVKMASLSNIDIDYDIVVKHKDKEKENEKEKEKEVEKEKEKEKEKKIEKEKDDERVYSASSRNVLEDKNDVMKPQKSPGKSKSRSDKKKKSKRHDDGKARSEKSTSTVSTTNTARETTTAAAAPAAASAVAVSTVQPQIDDKVLPAEEKKTLSILAQPARPISFVRSSSNSSRDSALAVNPSDVPPGEAKKAPASLMPNASMANITSNPMLAPAGPKRVKDPSATAEGIVSSGPKPLIMSSASLWANSKTLAMMSRLGKRKNGNDPTVPVPFAPIANQKSKKTDHPNEGINSDLESLRKVKQSLEKTLLSASAGVEQANASNTNKNASSTSTSSSPNRDAVKQNKVSGSNGSDSLSVPRRALEEDDQEAKNGDEEWDIKATTSQPRSNQQSNTGSPSRAWGGESDLSNRFTAPFSTTGTPTHMGSPARPTDLDVPGGISISAGSSGPPSTQSNELAAGTKAAYSRSQETLSECDDSNKWRGDATSILTKPGDGSSASVTTPQRKNNVTTGSDENVNIAGSLNHDRMHQNISTPVPPTLDEALSKKLAAEPKIGSPLDPIPSPKLAAFIKKNSKKNYE